MALIRKDAYGIFSTAGGWVIRPMKDSKFVVGDDPQTYHFGGSSTAGVGKTKTCKRGKYLEYWTTTGFLFKEGVGICDMNYTPINDQEIREQTDWYKNLNLHLAL